MDDKHNTRYAYLADLVATTIATDDVFAFYKHTPLAESKYAVDTILFSDLVTSIASILPPPVVTSGTRVNIPSPIVVSVLSDYQYWVYNNLTIGGTMNNAGSTVIANGALVLTGSGVFNNTGVLQLITI